jgi:hypothetical protein
MLKALQMTLKAYLKSCVIPSQSCALRRGISGIILGIRVVFGQRDFLEKVLLEKG